MCHLREQIHSESPGQAAWLTRSSSLLSCMLALAVVGSCASVIVRTRRSRGEERRQMKIFLAAVAVVFAVFFVPEEPLGLSGEAGQIALAVEESSPSQSPSESQSSVPALRLCLKRAPKPLSSPSDSAPPSEDAVSRRGP